MSDKKIISNVNPKLLSDADLSQEYETLKTISASGEERIIQHRRLAQISVEMLARKKAAAYARPFDPREDVSADAKYIVKWIAIQFFVVPLIAGIILEILWHL